MKQPVIIIGMGEMGELFARGFLKLGHPVYPVLRGMDLSAKASVLPEPELVIVAVGEDDLADCLATMPPVWKNRLALLQNELLPPDWKRHGVIDPTVIVVWFDKKKGRPFVNVLPTPIGGPAAALVRQSLQAIDVPCHEVPATDILDELARKNLYILVINIAGLKLHAGATVSELWADHRALAESVASEILDIQDWLSQTRLPRERLMAGLLEGFEGDPNHICTGRTAPKRLKRAIARAAGAGIQTPCLLGVAESLAVLNATDKPC